MASAVVVENLTKLYRKYSQKRRFQTMKSALIRGDLFRQLRPEEVFLALEKVSFAVDKGETFGIIGSNGAGKSTLLKIIAGTLRSTYGKVVVDGRISALIELGAGFHPEISGRENIYINGIMLGLSKREIQRRYDDIVQFAELEEFIESPIKTYSTGMYLRLGFAIAINVDPDILLIDEIIAVGDEAFARKCLDKIKEFQWKKKTILIVSHSLGMINTLCNRAVWLKQGKIEQMGDPRRVVDAYLSHVAEKEERKLSRLHSQTLEKFALAEEAKLSEEAPPPATEYEKKRWGSREIEIREVKLLDKEGQERHIFTSGEPMEVRMTIYARNKIKDFVFGVGIFNSAGISCYGTNTHLEKLVPREISGEATVSFNIKRLDLIQGTYFLDVAAHQIDGTPYDYHRQLYTFRVQSLIPDVGVFRPQHKWSFSPNISFKKKQNKNKV